MEGECQVEKILQVNLKKRLHSKMNKEISDLPHTYLKEVPIKMTTIGPNELIGAESLFQFGEIQDEIMIKDMK